MRSTDLYTSVFYKSICVICRRCKEGWGGVKKKKKREYLTDLQQYHSELCKKHDIYGNKNLKRKLKKNTRKPLKTFIGTVHWQYNNTVSAL